MTPARQTSLAYVLVPIAGIAWGLFWMPLRGLEHAGIAGVWAILMFQFIPVVCLLPFMLWRGKAILRGGRSLHVSGMLAGLAFILYSASLVYTDVVRALLFFYLSPLWSTLLARAILGERITPIRWIVIALAAIGLALIVRLDQGIGGALQIGDFMGLASGMVWAFAAIAIKSDEGAGPVDTLLVYYIWGSVVVVALLFLPLPNAASIPNMDTTLKVLPWAIPVILILTVPPTLTVLWGTKLISPGLISILFMTELSAGAITAAIWAGEPFGLRELTGVIVITAAGLIEPIWGMVRSPKPSPQ